MGQRRGTSRSWRASTRATVILAPHTPHPSQPSPSLLSRKRERRKGVCHEIHALLAQGLSRDQATLDEIVSGLIGVGLEVEAVEDKAKTLAAFTVAYVREARKHPNADRLRVCDVVTKDGVVQVVCGAPNARTGMTGIFAPPGTHIPGTGVDLEKGVIRGVESNGMLVLRARASDLAGA